MATESPSVQCELTVPAAVSSGQSVAVRLNLTNRGRTVVHVLVWGTPFEGWFAPFVAVRHNGTELRYNGPTVKRADPERGEYLRIAPGKSRHASVNLAEPFELLQPGRYRVEPRIVLHDVIADGKTQPPRPREQHTRLPLQCNPVEFDMRQAQS